MAYIIDDLAKVKNVLINGDMRYAQYGTSVSINATTFTSRYACDRWLTYRAADANPNTVTASRQSFAGATLPFRYNLRTQRNSGDTNTTVISVVQNVETDFTIPLQGKPVMLSFYARAGANFSASANALTVQLATGTGTDESFRTGLTGSANQINTTATLTTSWQRFNYLATIPTTATDMAVAFSYTPTGTAGASDYWEITGVQLVDAPILTPFQLAGLNESGELQLCQRYFRKSYAVDTAPGTTQAGTTSVTLGAVVFRGAAGDFSVHVGFSTPMRTIPTTVAYNPVSGAVGSTWQDVDNSATRPFIGFATGQWGISIYGQSASASGQTAIHYAAHSEII